MNYRKNWRSAGYFCRPVIVIIKRAIGLLYFVIAFFACTPAIALDDQLNPEILGQKVLAVQTAINNPDLPESMPAILALGHDSRYYVLVRGWLSQELQGSKSIAGALHPKINPQLDYKIQFLQKAIRAIDLE